MKRNRKGSHPHKQGKKTLPSSQPPPFDVSALLTKVTAYSATDPRDPNGRIELRLTDEEKTQLHRLALLGVAPWKDYYEVKYFEIADELWCNRPKEGMPSFRTIDQVRDWVRWEEAKHFKTADGREVTETVYNCYLPVFKYIRRVIGQPANRLLQQTVTQIQEVECADLHPSINFDDFWTKLVTELQQDAVEHFKWSVEPNLSEAQRECLSRMVFLSKVDVQLVYSVSQGERRDSKAYTLAEVYRPLLAKTARALRASKIHSPHEQDTDAEQFDDLLRALEKAFWSYDPMRGPVASWVKRKMDWAEKELAAKKYQRLELVHETDATPIDKRIPADQVQGRRRSARLRQEIVDLNHIPTPLTQHGKKERARLQRDVIKEMRDILTRQLGQQHYERRYIDGASATSFAQESGQTREVVAKREERARKITFDELNEKFGRKVIQDLLRTSPPAS